MAGNSRARRLSPLVRLVASCLPGWKTQGVALGHEVEAGVWQIMDFQLSKYVTSWSFTVNLGIHDVDLEGFLPSWPRLNTQKISTAVCNLGRTRLGELVDGHDQWWDLRADDAIAQLSHRLCSTLKKFAIPDLQHLQSREAIADTWMRNNKAPWFRGNQPMVLAALLKRVGRDREAEGVAAGAVAASIGSPSEEWSKTVAERLRP